MARYVGAEVRLQIRWGSHQLGFAVRAEEVANLDETAQSLWPPVAIADAGAFQARQLADVLGVDLLPPYRFARALAAPRWILMRSSLGLGF